MINTVIKKHDPTLTVAKHVLEHCHNFELENVKLLNRKNCYSIKSGWNETYLCGKQCHEKPICIQLQELT